MMTELKYGFEEIKCPLCNHFEAFPSDPEDLGRHLRKRHTNLDGFELVLCTWCEWNKVWQRKSDLWAPKLEGAKSFQTYLYEKMDREVVNQKTIVLMFSSVK